MTEVTFKLQKIVDLHELIGKPLVAVPMAQRARGKEGEEGSVSAFHSKMLAHGLYQEFEKEENGIKSLGRRAIVIDGRGVAFEDVEGFVGGGIFIVREVALSRKKLPKLIVGTMKSPRMLACPPSHVSMEIGEAGILITRKWNITDVAESVYTIPTPEEQFEVALKKIFEDLEMMRDAFYSIDLDEVAAQEGEAHFCDKYLGHAKGILKTDFPELTQMFGPMPAFSIVNGLMKRLESETTRVVAGEVFTENHRAIAQRVVEASRPQSTQLVTEEQMAKWASEYGVDFEITETKKTEVKAA